MFSYEFLHMDLPVLDQQGLASALFGHRMQHRRPIRSKWMIGMEGKRESQGTLYSQYDLMMLISVSSNQYGRRNK